MAYRFLLEVPEPLAEDAVVAVETAGDAQVLLVRDSHGLGFDDPYLDLTVASHTLRVIDTLYDWFDLLGASRPDIRLVLHSGERLTLEEHDRGGMVAAIRRDQPWVERTIPKIGDHEAPDAAPVAPASDPRLEPDAAQGLAFAPTSAVGTVAIPQQRGLRLLGLNAVAIQVADLARAEAFYRAFFGMELIGRARRGTGGEYESIDGDYRWDEAIRRGTEADVSVVGNGPVNLALHRAGRGARLERGVLHHLSIAVDAPTFATLKGEVLMRSMQMLSSGTATFTFRDPFDVAWELTIQATVPHMPDLGR